MDRELLIEIGCEEIPASWLPGLTRQVATHLDARLKAVRLDTDAKAESYSTPRRLTARVAKLAERQNDHEELVTGPPVSAAFKPDGEATPAAVGFARKYGVEVGALERSETPKGTREIISGMPIASVSAIAKNMPPKATSTRTFSMDEYDRGVIKK